MGVHLPGGWEYNKKERMANKCESLYTWKTWQPMSNCPNTASLRNEASLIRSPLTTSTSGLHLLLLGISLGVAFYLHIGSISGWLVANHDSCTRHHIQVLRPEADRGFFFMSLLLRSKEKPSSLSAISEPRGQCISQGLG